MILSIGLTTPGTTYHRDQRRPHHAQSGDEEQQELAIADSLGGAERRGITAVLGGLDQFRHFLAETQDERVVGRQDAWQPRSDAAPRVAN